MDDLLERASRWGIEVVYIDAQGRPQVAHPEAIGRILDSVATEPAPARYRHQFKAAGGYAYQGDESKRHWLLAIQLYGVRSSTNWGHGDFSDLAALIDLASEMNAAGIGLNPLHALFPDRPEQASPYAPNSRLFLNPLYIDVTAAPGFARDIEAELADELARLRATMLVDYTGVARAKMQALRESYRRFCAQPVHQDDFAAFRA